MSLQFVHFVFYPAILTSPFPTHPTSFIVLYSLHMYRHRTSSLVLPPSCTLSHWPSSLLFDDKEPPIPSYCFPSWVYFMWHPGTRVSIIFLCQNQNQNQNNFIWQHTTYRNCNVYKERHNYIYADMEAPTKTISGRYHRATRKINYTDHK